MTICIAGKNRIAVEAIEFLQTFLSKEAINVCINKTDDGYNTWQPSLKYYCEKNNIDIISLVDVYKLENSIFISLEFDRIVDPSKFQHLNIYNIHFSLLPAYKGMFTSILPILHGETETGVTLHYIDSGIDTGAIIDQESFEINLNENARDIYEKYLNAGINVFKRNIKNIVLGKVMSVNQTSIGSSYYSKNTIDFSKIEIGLNKTAYQIHNQIRAYSFREYQLPKILDKLIYKSIITNKKSVGKAGTVIYQDKYRIVLNTIDYQIELYIDQLQPLIQAAETGNIEFLNELIFKQYPIKTKTKQGWDILIIASYYNQKEFVKYLLEVGWDVNSTNYKGTTVLMYAMTTASKTNNLDTLKILSKHKMLKWRQQDNKRRDVLSYALEYGNTAVIKFITKYFYD